MLRIPGYVLIAMLGVTTSVMAQNTPPVDDCDRLAAHGPDPDRVTPGVPRKDVDVPKAIAACQKAVATHPETPRFAYQLGIALFYDKQMAATRDALERAVAGNYRQAQFMLGLMMSRKYEDMPQDECRVVDLWTRAGQLGQVNATVTLIRDTLAGRFTGCGNRPTKDAMRAMIKASAGKSDYLGNFLIEDMTKQLDAK